MCSLCGDPNHKDMECPCFGYVGGEYKPPSKYRSPRPDRECREHELSPDKRSAKPLTESPPNPRR